MNEQDKFMIQGVQIDVAEHRHYLELENVVCYLNYPNANGRQMNYGTTKEEQAATLERAQTLCEMPVYAKCAKNRKGQPTFKGHEVKARNGQLEFDTIPIGVHTDVRIEERQVVAADGSAQKLPVIIAKQRIWKRNKNAVAAILRLFSEGKLHNSWEVEVSQYSYKDGIKYLEDYSFLGNAFLGYEFAKPAFGKASAVISVAEESECTDSELMVAEALYLDVQEHQEEDGPISDCETSGLNEVMEVMGNTENIRIEEEDAQVENTKVSTEVTEQTTDTATKTEEDAVGETVEVTAEANSAETVETSALTDSDLRRELGRALGTSDDANGYIAFIFPTENEALIHLYRSNELDFVSVKYEVKDNRVNIISKTPVTLTVSPRNINAEIASRDEKIAILEKQNSELSEYKAKFEAAEMEKAEAERAAKRSQMVANVKRCKLFTEKEISSAPISDMIAEVDENKLKLYIAERLLDSQKDEGAVEASEVTPVMRLDILEAMTPGERLSAALRKYNN